MVKLQSEKEVVGVQLYNIELSEDELEILSAALVYMLEQCDDHMLLQMTGADRSEITGLRDDLAQIAPVFDAIIVPK